MAVFFFVGGPYDYAPRSFRNAWNLGHILFFFLFNYIILKKNTALSVWSYWKVFLSLLAFSVCLGTVIELLQWGTHRSPDYMDVVRDLIGCLTALVFFAPARISVPAVYLRSLQILVILIICIFVFPTTEAFYDEYRARKEFPILSDFEHSKQLERWFPNRAKISISKDIKRTGGASLEVNLTKTLYSGAELRYFPRDWSGYKFLSLSFYNPSSEPLKIAIRVHDEEHIKKKSPKFRDRFNATFILEPGWNDIKIPISSIVNAPNDRKMDLTKIMNVSFFVARLPQRRTIYVDDVKLVEK